MSALPVAASLAAGEYASLPAERRGLRRDHVSLLVTDRSAGTNIRAVFWELPRFLRSGDLLVVNDSETLAAALTGRWEDGSSARVHFSGEVFEGLWIVEPRGLDGPAPAGSIAGGARLSLPAGAALTFLAPFDAQHPRLWYARAEIPVPLRAYLADAGEPIRYRYVAERLPLADYQTIFARVPGSAEMPSAARPFTEPVVREAKRAGATFASITLHCGVSSMESFERPAPERFAVSSETADAVNAVRARGGRVIAVGTTVVRALESAVARASGRVVAANGWTDLIVGPDTSLAAVDGLLTGFHDPAASHIDMLEAFVSESLLERAYREARAGGYAWHEFGDVQLIV